MTIHVFKMKRGDRTLNVGNFDDATGIFSKRVSLAKHLFRESDSFGINNQALEALEKTFNCKKIELYEIDRQEKWEVDFDVFMAKSWPYHDKKFEPQRMLGRDWWTITSKSGLLMHAGRKIEPVPVSGQLKMI